jgi:NAD(P)-dependent dehydrogenase (short-subunit alcohol dehydrogenase family)
MSSSSLPKLSKKETSQFHSRRPTASQVIEEEHITDWSDKVVMITGASSGIGIETAKALAKIGTQLILPVRNKEKTQSVVEDIKQYAGEKYQDIVLLPLDLTSLESVRECATQFLALNRPLHVLICNAGVMATPEGMRTKDGHDYQFGVNHLAHFLLFELLKEKLLASSTPQFNSRVVMLSSFGHSMGNIQWDDLKLEKNYHPWLAYGQSKTANILMAREIEKRYGSQGLHANAVHPGCIMTNLGQYLEPAVVDQLLTTFTNVLKTPEQGAATTIWAAVSKEFEGKGGNYLEDCSYTFELEPPVPAEADAGCVAYAYDEESASRLYDISLKLTGLSQ